MSYKIASTHCHTQRRNLTRLRPFDIDVYQTTYAQKLPERDVTLTRM